MIPVAAVVVLAAKRFWILDPLYTALGTVLAWFYSVIPSFGGAIIALTLLVRLATFPLTAKQARSQQELQRLQPELKRLQAKYKHDRQRLNEEMMKFYKENHVNPFGGCLPVLLQLPVLIVLYRLILGLTHRPPRHIPTSSSMYRALRESGGKMVSWGMDLAQRASAVKGSKQVPFLILVALVVATGYYQQRQLSARLPKDSANSQMAMMGKIFPLFFGLISWSIPAGVVAYFLVSNIWQIGQQALIFRNQPPVPGAGAKAPPGTTEGKGGPKKKGPSATRTPGAKGGKPTGAGAKGSRKSSGGARGKDPVLPAKPSAKAGGGQAGGGQAGGQSKGAKGDKRDKSDRRGKGRQGAAAGQPDARAAGAESTASSVPEGTAASGAAAAGDGQRSLGNGRGRAAKSNRDAGRGRQ